MTEKIKIYNWKPKKISEADMMEFLHWFLGHKHFTSALYQQVPEKFRKHFVEKEVEPSQLQQSK